MKKTVSLLFFLLLFLSAIVSANTIYVDDDNYGFADGTIEHPYPYIFMGINKSQSGDTVYVFNGTYRECTLIDKPITLMGENRETTHIRNLAAVIFQITSDDVHIENFRFVNPTRTAYPEIYITADNCSITNNLFDNKCPIFIPCTISLNGANHNVISSNVFGGEAQMMAIALDNSHRNVIQNNTISASLIGIGLRSSEWNVITKNYLVALNSFYESSHNEITFNTFPGGPVLCLTNVTDTIVEKNNFGIYRLLLHLKLKNPMIYLENSSISFDGNYWGRSRLLPKFIFGHNQGKLVIEIDKHPAKDFIQPTD